MIPSVPEGVLPTIVGEERVCTYLTVWESIERPSVISATHFARIPESAEAVNTWQPWIEKWARGYGRAEGHWKLLRQCSSDYEQNRDPFVVATWEGDIPLAPTPVAPPVTAPRAPAILASESSIGMGWLLAGVAVVGGLYLIMK